MAYAATQGVWMPAPMINGTPTLNTSLLIDATGEMVAFVGRVWNKDRASKNITKVGFRFGAVTKAGGSALTVSLQDVDLATGPPYQPDGTQDQTVAIANANAAFVSNTWIQTGALSATRTVAFGELLAVVIEYDGAGRLAADSVVVSSFTGPTASPIMLTGGSALKTGGTWAVNTALNAILLEFDDGTFGTLEQGFPFSAQSSTAYNSGSAADEIALQFTVPFACKVDGAWVLMQAAASADFSIVLYDGTSAQATVAVDSNAILNSGSTRFVEVTFAEVTLTVGTTYYLSVKPTTANNVTVYDFSVNTANHFQAHPGGTSWVHNTRVDAGAWGTATATKRPYMGLRISALSDTVSGGGGVSRARANAGVPGM